MILYYLVLQTLPTFWFPDEIQEHTKLLLCTCEVFNLFTTWIQYKFNASCSWQNQTPDLNNFVFFLLKQDNYLCYTHKVIIGHAKPKNVSFYHQWFSVGGGWGGCIGVRMSYVFFWNMSHNNTELMLRSVFSGCCLCLLRKRKGKEMKVLANLKILHPIFLCFRVFRWFFVVVNSNSYFTGKPMCSRPFCCWKLSLSMDTETELS